MDVVVANAMAATAPMPGDTQVCGQLSPAARCSRSSRKHGAGAAVARVAATGKVEGVVHAVVAAAAKQAPVAKSASAAVADAALVVEAVATAVQPAGRTLTSPAAHSTQLARCHGNRRDDALALQPYMRVNTHNTNNNRHKSYYLQVRHA